MTLDDLANGAFDILNVMRYVITNLGTFFSYIFTPITGFFNFIKGFFDGVSTPPPTTEMTLGWQTQVMTIFNAIPHFSLFCWACGAAVAILLLVFIFRHLAVF